jgi:hypothetical protein
MLSPFLGYLPAGRDPLTSDGIATRSRRIRDDAGRYQPDLVLDQAVADGDLVAPGRASLFRYEITRESLPTITGLVGVARAADLVPHEGTVASAPDETAPSVEIRPILALVEGPLPAPPPLGGPVTAIEPDGAIHTLVPVDHGELTLDAPVIADGHHRRRAALSTRGAEATVLTLVVGEAGAGLEAGTFHRVFPHAGPLPLSASEVFEVEPMPSPAAVPGALVWLDGGSGRVFLMTPTPDALARVREALRASPAAVAQALLYPLLGLQEHEAMHAGTVEEAVAEVSSSGGTLLLPPVEIAAVIRAARTGNLLPPKASRFWPKPLRGMVLRLVGS